MGERDRLQELLSKVAAHEQKPADGLIERAYARAAASAPSGERDAALQRKLAVAELLVACQLDSASICAEFLHGSLSDGHISCDEVTENFGKEIAFLATQLARLPDEQTLSKQNDAERERKLLVMVARDVRVLVVRIAECAGSLRSIPGTPEPRADVAESALRTYAPLAHRMGLKLLKDEIQDSAFRCLYPNEHADLTRRMQEKAAQLNRVRPRLERLLGEATAGSVSPRFSWHALRPYEVFRRLQEQQAEFDQLMDLLELQIVVESVADCYAMLGAAHGRWTPLPGRFKDYIALPKPNMYQALHTTVIGPERMRVPLRIQTHEMQRVAEFGVLAHEYRHREESDAALSAADLTKFTWLRELVVFRDDLRRQSAAKFLESVRIDLFPDEVYVFTPFGDVRVLPAGSTMLDFAYAIHTEVGNHCAGSRSNGLQVPLRTPVQSGDVVEIVTSPEPRVSADWLELTKSPRARRNVRKALRRQKERAASALAQGSGNGSGVTPAFGEPALVQPNQVQLEGAPLANVLIAECCRPTLSDAIDGFFGGGRSVTVHRADCANVLGLSPNLRIRATWKGSDANACLVQIRVVTDRETDVLPDVTRIFADHGLSITQVTTRPLDERRAVKLFESSVVSATALHWVIRAIEKVRGVHKVSRG